MKKRFNIIGAIALSTTVLMGAISCANSAKDSKKEEEKKVTTPATSTVNAPAGSIVYVDMTVLMSEYQKAIDLGKETEAKLEELNQKLEAKLSSIESEIKRKENKMTSAANEIQKKQTEYEAAAKEFQEKYSKGLYTQTTAESKVAEIQKMEVDLTQKAQELQKLEVEYNQFLAQKQQEMQQEQMSMQATANEEMLVMSNIINDAINTFIVKYNQEKGFAMILMSQGDREDDGITSLGTPVLTANPDLNITADVVAGLNAEYNALK